jgi:hypothetical protein
MKIKNPFKRRESNLKKALKAILSVLIIVGSYIVAWIVGGIIGRKAGEIIAAIPTEEETPESLAKEGLSNFQKAVEKVVQVA